MKSLYYESFVPDNQLAADVRLFRRCAVFGHGISFPTMPHASANVISQALHALSLSSYRITLCCKMNNHPGIFEF